MALHPYTSRPRGAHNSERTTQCCLRNQALTRTHQLFIQILCMEGSSSGQRHQQKADLWEGSWQFFHDCLLLLWGETLASFIDNLHQLLEGLSLALRVAPIKVECAQLEEIELLSCC